MQFERLKSEIESWQQSQFGDVADLVIDEWTCCENTRTSVIFTISPKRCNGAPEITLSHGEDDFMVSLETVSYDYYLGSGSWQEGSVTELALSGNRRLPLFDLLMAVFHGRVWETEILWNGEFATSAIEIHVPGTTIFERNGSFVMQPLSQLFPALRSERRQRLPGYLG